MTIYKKDGTVLSRSGEVFGISSSKAMRNEVRKLKAQRDTLANALRDILGRVLIPPCEVLSHRKGTFHAADEPCPIMEEIKKALDAGRSALSSVDSDKGKNQSA